jgi:hypothetical protein
VRCNHCHCDMPDGSLACGECGTPAVGVLAPGKTPLSSEEERGSSALALLSIFFVLLFLMGSAAFVIMRVLPDSLSKPVEPIVLFATSAPPGQKAPTSLSAMTPILLTSSTTPAAGPSGSQAPVASPSVALPQVTATAVPQTTPSLSSGRTDMPSPISGSSFRVSQVRYGLHPDRARIVLDLIAPPSTSVEPAYNITNTPQRITVHIGVSSTLWVSEPKDALVQKLQMVPTGPATSDLVIDLTMPSKRVADTALNNPDRLVFDLFPQ